MSKGWLDRQRAARLMEKAGLDALVLCEPESFFYATGLSQGVAGLFRRAGAGFALVPADPARPIGVVVGDLFAEPFRQAGGDVELRTHPLWIETARVDGDTLAIEQALAADWAARRSSDFARPATFDLKGALGELKRLLQSQHLSQARIGFDLDFVPATDFLQIRNALPNALILNGSGVLARLRMVKQPDEVARLRLGASLADAGLGRLAAEAVLGASRQDLVAAFRQGVSDAAQARGVPVPPSWEYISIGRQPWGDGALLDEGDVVKADVGCVIDGYSSDSSRNFILGTPTPAQARLHAILEQAFAAGLEMIGPGRPLAAVHRTVTHVLHEAGLRGFSRGHFGHSLGQGGFCEQWPFIAADSNVSFKPGMVMAFEVPLYVDGVGGFNIEDQLLITEEGVEVMNRLPRQLMPLGQPPSQSTMA
ncbi:MAG: aminopeptidase P family protein [Paludibacterium sp.]|uniref:M24 family metallopeptidase n=1 Tax=Paludibacterium sp. TaxID=1917523 RepID=UPI0025DC036C|nr:Xaa-Pro peptidase family protein [Paludibacterium sp.]MBV8045605.1 aminopeptidase P family protein [Paludibacterium sp.]MBV8647681.1 aminopeptidase P family protein [Paludibacterium sp.]